MNKHIPKKEIIAVFLGFFVLAAFISPTFVGAVDTSELEKEISARKGQIDELNAEIEQYREKLDVLAAEQDSLHNNIVLIENQATLTELDIKATEANMEAAQLSLDLLNEQIRTETSRIKTQRAMLRQMIFELSKNTDVSIIELVFSSKNFNELFSKMEYLQTLSSNLNDTLDETKKTRVTLEEYRSDQELKIDDLERLEEDLQARVASLASQKSAINVLIDETKNSEDQYRNLLNELRQEHQYVNSRVSQLQEELQRSLADSNSEIDFSDTSMVSPLDSYIVTATFHDPTYPWRHLFEHSGLDMAAPTGTPVRAATGGVVAWARTVKSYGNYIMVIHDNGLSTLYAHLSAFNTSTDAFVSKGQVIGYVGSTGFSTGPHLHFEVRLNGIPVNPQDYIGR